MLAWAAAAEMVFSDERPSTALLQEQGEQVVSCHVMSCRSRVLEAVCGHSCAGTWIATEIPNNLYLCALYVAFHGS